jgi:hypothetical protein
MHLQRETAPFLYSANKGTCSSQAFSGITWDSAWTCAHLEVGDLLALSVFQAALTLIFQGELMVGCCRYLDRFGLRAR